LVVAASLPALAAAEGGWDSSLSGVRSGYTSRLWTDRNLDANATTSAARGCRRSDGATFRLSVELRKRKAWSPDVSYGRKDIGACTWTTASANWGRPGAGDYFLQYWHYDFGTVSASYVNARY